MVLSLLLHGIVSKKHFLPKLLKFLLLLRIKPFPSGLRRTKAMWKVLPRLIEDEFYACRYFPGAQDFLKKAHQYQTYFNFKRFNTYKKGSPVQLLQQAACHIDPSVLNFNPVLVDKFFHLYKNEFRLLAS